jgi:hypothetical protein
VEAKRTIKFNSQGVDCGFVTEIAGASQEEAFVAVSTGAWKPVKTLVLLVVM